MENIPTIPFARPFLLSVIIPARNEESRLPACLASLLAQSEPGFALGQQWELILVDDASTDHTRAIAEEAAAAHPEGITVLSAPELDLRATQRAFTGKTNACWAGAQASRPEGHWFLFTDADTVHETGDLSRSLHEAEKYHAKLLSYSPRQVVNGFWQHALMPLIFSELASTYSMRKVNDPNHRLAAANGQFLLIARETYFSTGGHRAVGTAILEDVELAQRVKRGKNIIRFRYAPDALSTSMYSGVADMLEGWTKNLALLFGNPLFLAAARLLDLLLLFGLPLLVWKMPPAFGWHGLGPILLSLLWIHVIARPIWVVSRALTFPGRIAFSPSSVFPLFVLPSHPELDPPHHPPPRRVEGPQVPHHTLAVTFAPLAHQIVDNKTDTQSDAHPVRHAVLLTRKADFSASALLLER